MDNALYNPEWHNRPHSYVPSLYKHLVPANLRLVGEYLLGRRSPITEDDFTQSDLDYMRQQHDQTRNALQDEYALNISSRERGENPLSISRLSEGYETGEGQRSRGAAIANYERWAHKGMVPITKYPGTTGNIDDYGWGEIVNSFSDPQTRVATSLGRYGVQNTPQGDMAYDTYDFNKYGTEKSEALSWDMLHNHPVKFLDTAIRKYNLGSPLPVQVVLPPRSQR